ncbi:hypothetical protein HJG60_011811 [Phyllostomus discolor]|uniref:Uncharacterized protein n=1 Tax=Phyllostomus discolor TaxID=89673 RepID=A0A834DVY3_9CHIR|nr:hypothetical protein HJG60_011811 [Phyllostomus discolor]
MGHLFCLHPFSGPLGPHSKPLDMEAGVEGVPALVLERRAEGSTGSPLAYRSPGGSCSGTESPGRKGSCLHRNCSARQSQTREALKHVGRQLDEAASVGRGRRKKTWTEGKRGRAGVYGNSWRVGARPSQPAAP